MGKNKKKNKRKFSTKPASNQNETAASTSTEAIQVTGYSPQNVTEAAAQTLQTPESALANEAVKGLVNAIIECIKVELGLREMTDLQREELGEIARQNLFTLNALNCDLNKLLSDKDPTFVENVEKYITLQSELKFLKAHVTTAKEVENLIKAESSDEIKKSILQDDSNEQVESDTSVLQYRPNEMSLDLKIDERKKTDDVDISADIIKEARDSSINIEEIAEDIPLVTHSNKTGKTLSIQNEYARFDSTPPDLETVWKLLDSKLNEYEKKRRSVELAVKSWKEKQDNTSPEKEMAAAISKDKLDDATKESKEAADQANALIQKLKRVVIQKDKKDAKSADEIQTAEHFSEIRTKGRTVKKNRSGDFQTAGLSPRNVTEGKKGAALKNLKDKIDTLSPETGERENYATRVSKEAADQVNDLIKELKTIEIGKEVKMDEEKFTDEIQRASCFPGNTAETVAGTKDSNKSTGDLQVENDSLTVTMLNIDTDNTTCEHMEEKRSLEKSKTKKMSKSDEVFKRDLKNFLKIQNAKLDKQLKECGFLDTKSKILKEKPSLSSEKDSATSEAVKQCETTITPKPEVSSTEVKQDRTVPLDKFTQIEFEFQTDGDKYIKVGNREFISSLEDDLEYEFKFSDKKVEVYFSADHIYVSTENSEFDILVRKLQPADLKDDATQTDNEP